MSTTPLDEPLRFVGTSDGEILPPGEFLVVVYPSGVAELAHKDSPGLVSRTWSPPLRLEVAP